MFGTGSSLTPEWLNAALSVEGNGNAIEQANTPESLAGQALRTQVLCCSKPAMWNRKSRAKTQTLATELFTLSPVVSTSAKRQSFLALKTARPMAPATGDPSGGKKRSEQL